MLSRLHIRSKLLLTVVLPLVVIAALGAVAYPTFQSVKVNGPRYDELSDLKDLVADILPPPALGLEGHLVAGQIAISAPPEEMFGLVRKIRSLSGQFAQRHRVWQQKLPADDPLRVAMDRAFTTGTQYFDVVNRELIPLAERLATSTDETRPAIRQAATGLYEATLSTLYRQHRVAVDQAVEIARTRQTRVEVSTRRLIEGRLALLGGFAATLFALVGLLGFLIARSIGRPVRALTAAAQASATTHLPAVVSEIQSGSESVAEIPRPPYTDARDELGELARAFASMQTTAVGLATEQAKIRRNVSSNLVNVGRRNQGLLKRMLSFITVMEQEERDSTKLEQLFRLDHLTTRMRRNAESLLVLAGAEPPRAWSSAVGITDVVRAAISQVEAFDRVELANVEPTKVKGQTANDVAHMLAELLENATYFSPPTTKVTVHGRMLLHGYLLVIADDGVGMSAEEIRAANQRLSNPHDFDAQPAKVLGHLVVGQLATRHGVRVQLVESVTGGIAAQLSIPPSLLEGDVIGDSPSRDTPTAAPGRSAGANGHSAPEAPVSGAILGDRGDPTRGGFAFQRRRAEDLGGHTMPVSEMPMPGPDHSSEPQPVHATQHTSPAQHTIPVQHAPSVLSAPPVPVASAVQASPQSEVPTRTASGLTRRVRGANMPDTGPSAQRTPDSAATDDDPSRDLSTDPEQVRLRLASFQRGVAAGKTATPDRGER